MAQHSSPIAELEQSIKKQFESNRRLLTFDEYLHVVQQNPQRHLRGSAQYALEMLEHFGRDEKDPQRFKLFDLPIDGISRRVVGHSQVQQHLYRALKSFARQRVNNRLLLLHGPNGSAKSSIAQALMHGFELYGETDAGAMYTFSWVFPIEKLTKGTLGLGGGRTGSGENIGSYAKLAEEDIAVKISSDLKDHPLLLIPVQDRRKFLETLVGKSKADELWQTLPLYLVQGDLCPRSKQIAEALLTAYKGDFKKVLMHIQVERFYYSRRYRSGLISIEPQMHVDAHAQQLTMNRSFGALPASLQSLNLFSLSGDLIEGNRGIIEFNDLLKRPLDSYKYLLTFCESGNISIGSNIAALDTLLIGTTNELQLDAFKEFPDFTSFKGRIELIRVPYLLSVHQEKEIYSPELPKISLDKPVAPHTDWVIAFWGVLTRLKRPNSVNYPPDLATIINKLTPLEKARIYDTEELPGGLNPEEKKLLRTSIHFLYEEYTNVPYYEGRMGASARELKAILYDAAQNPSYSSLSPLAVFQELEQFVKRVSEYEFLRQEIKDGYHDAGEFIQTVREEYLGIIDQEVRESMGLYDSGQWETFIKKYVQNISLVLKKEKTKNPMTGQLEDPDHPLIDEFEKIVDAPKDSAALEAFRRNIIAQVGVWSLNHLQQQVIYRSVFPDFWKKIEKHYFESQKSLLQKVYNALLLLGDEKQELPATDEGAQLARKAMETMKKKYGYTEASAKEVMIFLMRSRY